MDNYFSRYVHLALSGDSSAFETLYNFTKDSVYFVILRAIKNEKDAVGILQNSYIYAFENLNILKNTEAFDVWLYKIAAGMIKKCIEKKNPTVFQNIKENYEWNDEDNYDKLPQESVDDKNTKSIINEIVDNLPDEQRLIILMHYYQEMTVWTIAEALDLSENAVKYTLSAARKVIKARLEQLKEEGTLLCSASLSTIPFVLLDSAKMQFLFHPAPPISSIIALPESTNPQQNNMNVQQILEQQILDNIVNSEKSVQTVAEVQSNEEYSDNIQAESQQEAPDISYNESGGYSQTNYHTNENKDYNTYEEQSLDFEQAFIPRQESVIEPQTKSEPIPELETEVTPQAEPNIKFEPIVEPIPAAPSEPEPIVEPIPATSSEPEPIVEPIPATPSEPEPIVEPIPATPSEPEPIVEPIPATPSEPEPIVEPIPATSSEPIIEDKLEKQPEPEAEPKKTPMRNEPYKRVLESNFSIENAPKTKKRKESVIGKKIGGLFKSKTGIIVASAVALIAVAGGVVFLISMAAQNSSISKNMEGMKEVSLQSSTVSNAESSRELTEEEIRAAKYEEDKKNYKYKSLSDGTLCITGYSGSMENAIIPETIANKKVTAIGKSAFQGCTRIKSITIPKYVNSISLDSSSANDNPFYDCIYMKNIYVDSENAKYISVDGVLFTKDQTELLCYPASKLDIKYTVPSSVKKIGAVAFLRNSMLEEITIPNGITRIESETFANCASLKDIKLPDSLKIIGKSAFMGCVALKSINIPVNVTEIGQSAFKDCTSINNVVIPANVIKIGENCFRDCTYLYNCTVMNSELKFADMDNIRNGGIFAGANVTIRASRGSTAIIYAKKCKLDYEVI